VTIRDVARRAGVAVSTASLALNGKPNVSPEVARRVRRAALELGYKPNAVARSLKTRRTQLISLVVADVTNPFFSAMARGAEEALSRRGYSLIICNTDEDAAKEAQLLDVCLHKKVDGVLLVPTGEQHAAIRALAEESRPLVLLDRLAPWMDADAVLSDNIGGAYAATQHLIETGHRRIGLIAGHVLVSAIRERVAGHVRALRDHGIRRNKELTVWAGHTSRGGYEACLELLKLEPPPTAIFSANNLMVRGAMIAVRELGLTWPDDVSLIGFDDFEEAELVTPPVTAVAQQPFQMGLRAGELLLDRLERGNSPTERRQLRLETSLVHRGSVATPHAGCEEVIEEAKRTTCPPHGVGGAEHKALHDVQYQGGIGNA